eukprot:gene57437-biopygen88876
MPLCPPPPSGRVHRGNVFGHLAICLGGKWGPDGVPGGRRPDSAPCPARGGSRWAGATTPSALPNPTIDAAPPSAARPVVPTPSGTCSGWTPWALGPLCNRGERELPGWSRERDGVTILGSYAETMAAIAQWLHGCCVQPRRGVGELRV